MQFQDKRYTIVFYKTCLKAIYVTLTSTAQILDA